MDASPPTTHPSTSPDPSFATESLTPLEQEVLEEYARLLGNLNNVSQPLPLSLRPLVIERSPNAGYLSCTPEPKSCSISTSLPLSFFPSEPQRRAPTNACAYKLSAILADLSSNPSAEILDALRGLERKTSLVFTLLKASVYSIVLQQQIGDEEGVGRDGG